MVLTTDSYCVVLATNVQLVAAFRKALAAHVTVIMLGCWFGSLNIGASLLLHDETLVAILDVFVTIEAIVLVKVLEV